MYIVYVQGMLIYLRYMRYILLWLFITLHLISQTCYLSFNKCNKKHTTTLRVSLTYA